MICTDGSLNARCKLSTTWFLNIASSYVLIYEPSLSCWFQTLADWAKRSAISNIFVSSKAFKKAFILPSILSIVSGIGIDYIEDNYIVTFEVLNSNKSDILSDLLSYTITGQGKT